MIDKKIFMPCLIFLIIVGIVASLTWNENEQIETFNNGIHEECGGEWHLVAKGKTVYYYECDKCGITFVSDSLMK